MLKSILVVTIAVAQLNAVESAWQSYLDYESRQRGTVSEAAAEVWGTPAAAGQPYLLMQAPSGDPALIRFIEAPEVPGYAPMTTYGWNATELLVKDPDAIAERLAESPFEIIGAPHDLWDAPNAPRAMQVIGPGRELLYLTRNANFETRTAIDRVFIMVVGGPSMVAFRDFYGERLGLVVGEATAFQIGVVSNALGLPDDTTYPLAIATVSPRFLIELDEYPEAAGPRPRSPGALPPGIAMVSFAVDDLALVEVDWRASPARLDGPPYDGRRAAVTVGPAGEWIELIETPAD